MALVPYPVEEMKRLAERERQREDDELVALWAELNDGQDLRQVTGWGRIVQFASRWGQQLTEDDD